MYTIYLTLYAILPYKDKDAAVSPARALRYLCVYGVFYILSFVVVGEKLNAVCDRQSERDAQGGVTADVKTT